MRRSHGRLRIVVIVANGQRCTVLSRRVQNIWIPKHRSEANGILDSAADRFERTTDGRISEGYQNVSQPKVRHFIRLRIHGEAAVFRVGSHCLALRPEKSHTFGIMDNGWKLIRSRRPFITRILTEQGYNGPRGKIGGEHVVHGSVTQRSVELTAIPEPSAGDMAGMLRLLYSCGAATI